MTYKERYILENRKAIIEAHRRVKIVTTIAFILIWVSIVVIMIGISALDFDPIRGAMTMAVGALNVIIILTTTRLMGIDLFEESDEEE